MNRVQLAVDKKLITYIHSTKYLLKGALPRENAYVRIKFSSQISLNFFTLYFLLFAQAQLFLFWDKGKGISVFENTNVPTWKNLSYPVICREYPLKFVEKLKVLRVITESEWVIM